MPIPRTPTRPPSDIFGGHTNNIDPVTGLPAVYDSANKVFAFAEELNAVWSTIVAGTASAVVFDLFVGAWQAIDSAANAFFPTATIGGNAGSVLIDLFRTGSEAAAKMLRIRSQVTTVTGNVIETGTSDFGDPETYVPKFWVTTTGDVTGTSFSGQILTSLLQLVNGHGEVDISGDGITATESNCGATKKLNWVYASLDLSTGLVIANVIPSGVGASEVSVIGHVTSAITGSGGLGSVTVGFLDGSGTECASALGLASNSKFLPGDGTGGYALSPRGGSLVFAPDVGAITGGGVEVAAFWYEYSIPDVGH